MSNRDYEATANPSVTACSEALRLRTYRTLPLMDFMCCFLSLHHSLAASPYRSRSSTRGTARKAPTRGLGTASWAARVMQSGAPPPFAQPLSPARPNCTSVRASGVGVLTSTPRLPSRPGDQALNRPLSNSAIPFGEPVLYSHRPSFQVALRQRLPSLRTASPFKASLMPDKAETVLRP